MRSKWNGEPPYREIDFGFVFVRAVRAGEAKLRGRARSVPPLAEARLDQMSLPGGRWRAVSRRCPAGVPSVSLWLRRGRTKCVSSGRPVARSVPPVSRWCPVGVPSVSR